MSLLTDYNGKKKLANFTETDTELKMKALLKMKSLRRKPGNSKALVCPSIQQKC